MLLIYALALVGFVSLWFLAVVGILTIIRHGQPSVEDDFDQTATVLHNIHEAAWRSIQELREVGGKRHE